MFPAIGLVVLLVMIFGGFAITGGALGPVMEAIPHELLIIGGAAVGALIIGNSMKELKALGGGLMKVFKGPKYKKQDYLDVIFLVSKLMKMLRTEGPIALEPHVEDPASSAVFAEYPRLLSDHTLTNLIADTLRLVVVSSGTLDVHAVEDVMDNMIKTHHHEVEGAQGTLATLADALPALGIVAAVLGVVKTMGSIDQPTEILGAMIGGALVGTFMGVLLSYCLVGPLASKLLQVVDEDGQPFQIAKAAVIAHAQGQATQVAVEIARRMTPSAGAPTLPDDPKEDRSLRLPAHCTTVTAEDLRVRLVLAMDLDHRVEIDASQVASIGQAVLQLLLAGRAEAERAAQPFAILQPSAAFLERVGTKLILTVDDSASMRMLLKSSLSAQGYQIESANDGVHGLERMHEVQPDLLITDINMPRMDGFGLIEAVRAVPEFRGTPILVLSTEFSDEKKMRARESGATGWITKPFEAAKLGAAIRRV
eukprot:gene22710-23947_t